jgi:hypothetical protein
MLWSYFTGVTANLELKYLRPTWGQKYYIFSAWPDPEGATDRKQTVNGVLMDISGNVCVAASGLFVVPKNIQLHEVRERF